MVGSVKLNNGKKIVKCIKPKQQGLWG